MLAESFALAAGLCFVAGVCVSPILLQWWRKSRPVYCRVCRRFYRVGQTYPADHRKYGITRLCDACWRAEYLPTKGRK